MATKIAIDIPMSRVWELTTKHDKKNYRVKSNSRSSNGYPQQIIFFTIDNMEYEVTIGGVFVMVELVRANGQSIPKPKHLFGSSNFYRGLERYTAVFTNGAPLGDPIKKDEVMPLILNGVEIVKVKRKY